MVLAIATTFCAAALVLYLQHRAISALDSQTRVILRQISEQTATDIAMEVRRTLDGPVFDTLTAVNHPELRAGRLDLVAHQYAQALEYEGYRVSAVDSAEQAIVEFPRRAFALLIVDVMLRRERLRAVPAAAQPRRARADHHADRKDARERSDPRSRPRG